MQYLSGLFGPIFIKCVILKIKRPNPSEVEDRE